MRGRPGVPAQSTESLAAALPTPTPPPRASEQPQPSPLILLGGCGVRSFPAGTEAGGSHKLTYKEGGAGQPRGPGNLQLLAWKAASLPCHRPTVSHTHSPPIAAAIRPLPPSAGTTHTHTHMHTNSHTHPSTGEGPLKGPQGPLPVTQNPPQIASHLPEAPSPKGAGT